MALAVWTEPVFARSYLNCITKKVVIIDAPRGSTSSSIEENLGFWIDETAKTVVLADGMPLTVRRFDGTWISATRGDMSYELDRQNGNLTYGHLEKLLSPPIADSPIVNVHESEREQSGISRRQFCGVRRVAVIFRGSLKLDLACVYQELRPY
jgi:hypothetical protein